jgi:hypothetical protein
MPEPHGFPRAVRYALVLAFAFALALLALYAFHGFPVP